MQLDAKRNNTIFIFEKKKKTKKTYEREAVNNGLKTLKPT